MREITTLEASAVVGGIQEVHITRKRDDGASTASLKSVVHNSGGNSAGGAGGGGGGSSAAAPTITCTETIVQVRQAGTGPKIAEFGYKGIKIEVTPKIESVTTTSVCTYTKPMNGR